MDEKIKYIMESNEIRNKLCKMGICSVIGPAGDRGDIGPVGETGISHEIIIDETKTINPDEPAKVINNGIEIYEVSNQPFLDGVEYNKKINFHQLF